MYGYVIVMVILIGFIVLRELDTREGFISLFTKHTSYLESTAMHPINYSKCVGMPSDENRIDKAPFYVKTFSRVNYTLGNIAYQLQQEISRLNAKVASVLIITYGGAQDIYLLFPEFSPEEERVVPFALIAKNHRWYYLLLYNLYYNAGNFLCLNPAVYGQCYGIRERLVVKNYFFIRYMDWYITPCGASGGANPSPMVPIIKQNDFYAHYVPNPKQFPNITPYPNLAYMSQYDTIKYGCDSQMVSENRRFILLLEQSSRSFGVYRVVGGNPFDFCTSGVFVPKVPLWRVQLSSRLYATFKIESNYVVLVDYDRPIFKITVPTKKVPIVMKLNNQGELEFYDSENNKVDMTLGFKEIDNAIKGITAVKGLELDYDAMRNNATEEDRRQKEIAARAREAEEQQLRDSQLDDYNKRVCPIGS